MKLAAFFAVAVAFGVEWALIGWVCYETVCGVAFYFRGE